MLTIATSMAVYKMCQSYLVFSKFRKEIRLCLLSLGVYVTYLCYGYFQELSFSRPLLIDGEVVRTETVYLSFVCAANSLTAWILLGFTLPERSQIPHQRFILLSVVYLTAMLSSNIAIRFISYSTQVLGKSLKPFSVLVFNLLFNGYRYQLYKYVVILLVSIGIILYSWDATDTVNPMPANWFGVGLVFFSLICDGACSAI